MTTEQPPGAPSTAQPPVNPYQELTNAYYAPGRAYGPAVQAAWMPPPTRSWKGPVAVAVVAVALLGFGVAFGANEYAKRDVCGAVAAASSKDRTSAGTPAVPAANTTAVSTSAAQSQNVEKLRADIDATRAYANLLVLDADLRTAVKDLTNDADSALRLGEELGALTPEERLDNMPRLVTLASNMDTHWRAVQRACGQTETGV